MPDIDQNITVDVTGNTASIATDYTTSGVTNAHVQITKLSFGDTTTATRVTTTSPLPVDIRTATATVGITGSVGGLGNFKVINGLSGASTLPLVVSGTTSSSFTPVQISGYVQGVTSGILVGVTGTLTARDGLRVQGVTSGTPIAITGGRNLSPTTDTVGVTGTVTITGGRYMLQSTDSIRIFGGGNGETLIPMTLRDTSGNSINSTAGALNVNVVGAGITATVTVNPVVGICQANQAVPLFVAGATAGPAVRVQGTLGANNAVEVGWSSAQNVNAVNVVTINDANLVNTINALPISGIKTDTANITSINTKLNSSSGVNAQIVGFTRPGTVYTGNASISSSSTTTLSTQQLKTGVTLKAVAGDILVRGVGSANGYLMSSGDILFVETGNLANLSFQTPSGTATLYYLAT